MRTHLPLAVCPWGGISPPHFINISSGYLPVSFA